MNEDIRKKVEHAGLTYLPPMDRKTELIGLANPLTRRSSYHNREYQKNVESIVQEVNEAINRNHSILNQEIIGPNGQRIMRGLNSPYNVGGQRQLEKFKELIGQNTFYTFDIETLGDAMNQRNFHVSEIAIMGLHRTGDHFAENGDRFIRIIRPDESMRSRIMDLITRLEADPYEFLKMTESERRMIVDLTRYSSLTEADIKGFQPVFDKHGNLIDYTHNTLANRMFEREVLVNHRVINKMDSILRHAKQGLHDITHSKYAVDANKAINDYNAFVNTRKQSFFVSYNGESFDLPVLAAWGGLKGNQPIVRPEKHLDYYRVIQTAFPNPIDLHHALGRNSKESPLKMGALKLPEFMVTLTGSEQAAHSALVDIGEKGLGGLVSESMDIVSKQIRDAEVKLHEGINLNEPRFTWVNEPLRIGQTLFSAGGFRARQDGELSFAAKLDSNGALNPITDSFNTTIVNAYTAYEVADYYEMGSGDTRKIGISLYDRERDRYVHIIRQGENAFDELASFIQNRFYNVEGMTPQQREALRARRLRDAARRKYESMYSLAGAGQGKANGFELSKRMYENADIAARRLLGKHKHIAGENYHELKAQRMTHAELEEALKGRMDSLWDPNTRSYVHNESEKQLFFRMAGRLVSEKDYFLPALRYIEENIDDPQLRDIAWRNYRLKIEEQFAPPKETIELMDFENKRVYFQDIYTNQERSLNMASLQSALSSIRREVYTPDITQNEALSQRVKEDRYRERLNLLIKNLRASDVIDRRTANQLTDIAINSATVNNAIVQISNTLASMDLNYRREIETTSLAANEAIQKLDPAINKLLYQEAVEEARRLPQIEYFSKQVPGLHFNFSPELEEYLRELDEPHLSQLKPNNRRALEHLLKTIEENGRAKDLNYALSYDRIRNNIRVSLFRQQDSTSVVEQLSRGASDLSNAVTIDLPLISRAGVHSIGNRKINARTIAVYNESTRGIELRSTAERIAEDYASIMHRIANQINQGNFEEAQKQVQRALNRSVQELSGIQRNLSMNDTFHYSHTFADFLKQSSVDVDTAMIHDLFYNQDTTRVFRTPGKRDPAEAAYRLTEQDFRPGAFINGKLRPDVSIDDLWDRPAFELGLYAPQWFDEHGLDLNVGSLKSDMAIKNIFAQADIRDYMPYGYYTFHGRDNPVQFQNSYAIERRVRENIERAIEGTGAYVEFDNPLVTTQAMLEFDEAYAPYFQDQYRGMNVKVAMMNDAEILKRIRDLQKTEEGRELLLREGILRSDGTLDPLRIPRVYENQGVIASDIQGALKVREEKVLSQTDQVNLFKQYQDGSIVEPGAYIGTERVNGIEVPIYYNEKVPGRLIVENGRIAVTWDESPHKFMLEGEKLTDVPVSRELIHAITGDESVSFIINANMKKHKDFSMYLSGKAKILTEELSKVNRELQHFVEITHENDKASRNAIQRDKLRRRRELFLEEAKRLNLRWDDTHQVFIQEGTDPISAETVDDVFRRLGLSHTTPHGDEVFILEARASKVRNYSRMTDEFGRVVIGVRHNEKGEPIRIYKREPEGVWERDRRGRFVQRGVRWGHREMGVLRDKGLHHTYDQVYGMMIRQADEKGTLSRVMGMNAALEAVANPESPILKDAGVLRSEHFELLRTTPEIDADWNTYRQTVFDQDYIQQITGGQNQHGYWLELPAYEEPSGEIRRITADLYGGKDGRRPIERIFIPFTNLEGANGQVYLDELQKLNRDIIRRAEEVVNANQAERGDAMRRLQDVVDQYFDQLRYDMTSSKGYIGERVFKADLASSGSGIFKLLDPDVSMHLDGEFTFINPEDAKAMGLYDTLKDIEMRRAAGETVEDLMVMNVRYPVFHSYAMQITKLRMDDTVRQGEFMTTSWISELMVADSDGDYDHISVLRNEDGSIDMTAQKEWRRAYNREMAQREQAYQKFLEDDAYNRRQFNAEYILDGEREFKPIPVNAQDEVAANIGRRVIGAASNLNFYMRQMGMEFLPHDSPELQAVLEFGQMIEQKPISAKHGFAIEPGRVPAVDLVNAIYNRDWTTLREIRRKYYADDFDEDVMERAIRGLDQIVENMERGLRSPGLKFGTSYGIGESTGLVQTADLIHARTANNQRVRTNQLQRMIQRTLGVDTSKTFVDVEGNVHESIDPYEVMEGARREPRGRSFAATLGEYAEDLSGGSEMIGSKVREFLEAMSENRRLRWGVIGAGLALGALGGYNILRHDKPIVAPSETDGHYIINEPIPTLDMESNALQLQNADIQITAEGEYVDEQQLSHMVNQGIVMSNMNTGPTRITINHTDNTNKLNRIWYRDTVQENI